VDKVTQCGGDDLVSAYVHVASAFAGDAVEELHHELLKVLGKIHMSYIATKPAKKKEDWRAVFPADVLSGQSSLLDDLLRTVLSGDSSVQTHIQQVSYVTELYRSQRLRSSTVCTSFRSDDSVSTLLTVGLHAPCYYAIAAPVLQGATFTVNSADSVDAKSDDKFCSPNGIFSIPKGGYLDAAVGVMLNSVLSSADNPAILAAEPLLLARLCEEPAAMTEKCFSTIAKTMAAMNSETSYIQTVIEAAVKFPTLSSFISQMKAAVTQAKSRPFSVNDFNAILGKLIESAIRAGCINTRSALMIIFAEATVGEAILDEATIDQVVEVLVEVKGKLIAAQFYDYSTDPDATPEKLQSIPIAINYQLAVKCKRLMEALTVNLRSFYPSEDLGIPPGYDALKNPWTELIRTGDSAFLTMFSEMCKEAIHTAVQLTVTPRVREFYRLYFTVVKECLCVTSAGKSVWVSIQNYGIKALQSKKLVQTMLAQI
jgi:hypothetical protein